MNIIVMGHQGSGKGTQAEMLSKRFSLLHVETGKILRNAAKTDPEIDRLINKKGSLVPPEVAFKLTKEFILKKTKVIDGVVFDGFPRTKEQFQLLKNWFAKRKAKIDHVFFLKVSQKESVKRLSSRRMCTKCGEVYNLITNPPPSKNCKCGGKLIQREDSKPRLIKERLNWSVRESKPLIAIYKKRGVYQEVDGERPIGVIHKDIMSRLEKLNK